MKDRFNSRRDLHHSRIMVQEKSAAQISSCQSIIFTGSVLNIIMLYNRC